MAERSKGILITGTDTAIGKTMVSCAIVAALSARGRRIGVYKPVETGCEVVDGDRTGADCRRLADAAGARQTPSQVASYLFELPAAPLVAAEASGRSVDPAKLTADYNAIAQGSDRVIVEGAGGLMVPIADRFTYLDLARQLDLPVVCVVGSRLGCINHALLSLAALESAGLTVLGYVVNGLHADSDDSLPAESNRSAIARFTDQRDLGLFPYVPEDEREDYAGLARAAENHLRMDCFE